MSSYQPSGKWDSSLGVTCSLNLVKTALDDTEL